MMLNHCYAQLGQIVQRYASAKRSSIVFSSATTIHLFSRSKSDISSNNNREAEKTTNNPGIYPHQKTYKTTCCIVGGGPAGLVSGFLLARSGVDVVVLEKHKDFLRDFRGDTIHPSTLELMNELGLLKGFLERPHDKVARLMVHVGDRKVPMADYSKLKHPFIAMMPQWEFLNFLADNGKRYPNFHLIVQADVDGLIKKDGKVVGAQAKTPQGNIEVHSSLVIGADGRHGKVRGLAGLTVEDIAAPIDVLWFRLSKQQGDESETMMRLVPGQIMIMINRNEYWQCAYVIPKGGITTLKEKGLDNFKEVLIAIKPFLKDRVQELKTWDQVHLLTVKVDHLIRWHAPGVLCIGDSAHAMSPVGGVGVNLAVQDAVAASNILSEPLRAKKENLDAYLKAVQERREWPTKMTQRVQVQIHKVILNATLDRTKPFKVPLPVRLISRSRMLQQLAGRLMGIGFRPESVKTKPA